MLGLLFCSPWWEGAPVSCDFHLQITAQRAGWPSVRHLDQPHMSLHVCGVLFHHEEHVLLFSQHVGRETRGTLTLHNMSRLHRKRLISWRF